MLAAALLSGEAHAAELRSPADAHARLARFVDGVLPPSISRSARCKPAPSAARGAGDAQLCAAIEGIRLFDLRRYRDAAALERDALRLPCPAGPSECRPLTSLLLSAALESTFGILDFSSAHAACSAYEQTRHEDACPDAATVTCTHLATSFGDEGLARRLMGRARTGSCGATPEGAEVLLEVAAHFTPTRAAALDVWARIGAGSNRPVSTLQASLELAELRGDAGWGLEPTILELARATGDEVEHEPQVLGILQRWIPHAADRRVAGLSCAMPEACAAAASAAFDGVLQSVGPLTAGRGPSVRAIAWKALAHAAMRIRVSVLHSISTRFASASPRELTEATRTVVKAMEELDAAELDARAMDAALESTWLRPGPAEVVSICEGFDFSVPLSFGRRHPESGRMDTLRHVCGRPFRIPLPLTMSSAGGIDDQANRP